MTQDETSPPRRRGFLRRLLRGLGLGLAALIAALLLAELSVRALGIKLPPWMTPENHNLLMKVSEDVAPGLGTVLRPGASATRFYPGVEPGTGREVVYQINQLGFREVEMQAAKPAGVYRIVTLGDSVTYGTGVALEDTLAHQLERVLSAALPDAQIQVLNCGVPSTNTGQHMAMLRQRALKFDPDMVLLTSTIVDASGYGVQGPPQSGKPWQVEWIETLGLTSGVYEFDGLTPAQARQVALRQVSRLADLTAHYLYRSLYWDVLISNYKATWVAGGPGVSMIRRALGSAAELARLKGFRMHVGLYPFLSGLQDTYPFVEEVERMRAICAEVGLPFHDLLEPLKGYPPVSLQAHRHDRHPNGKANGLVVDWLAPRLLPDIRADLGL